MAGVHQFLMAFINIELACIKGGQEGCRGGVGGGNKEAR